ncbi:Hypothetical protein LUCI_4369 [Lucifera butyrica]|uniref:Uncharacterized protein n=1 Tax=Lucifera butyrica TaxID=1351585 RepID=A0A498RG60_9FIRM|nr:metallophosphoesterase family protein [Lucifera butyrica]VBB09083.1 Hypothetical protein LUCI_4369 [Lucifera butyrica]
MLPRRTFLCSIFLVVFSVILLTVLSAVVLGAGFVPDHIILTWKGDPGTTQTITWRTKAPTGPGEVRYAAMTENIGASSMACTVAAVERLVTNEGDVYLHSATLTGLKPGVRYLYRVGDGENWSEIHTFITAADTVAHFTFLVFGDSQSIDYNVWRTTLQAAYRSNPGAAFLVNVGDLVDRGQDMGQWNAWFDAGRGVIDTIPVMPATGNHEMYTPMQRFSRPVFFTAQFKLPQNGPDGLRGQAYSFDYGNVHFIVLDSQENEEGEQIPKMLARQKAWLEKDLAATDKKWKMAFFHRPPYSNKDSEDNATIRAAFVPVLEKYHTDVVFTGHDHVYARTYPMRGGVAADPSVRGTMYVATGRSGTKTYPDGKAEPWDRFFYNPQDEPNYIMVEAGKDVLTVKAFKQSGSLIDSWNLYKK